MYLTYRPGTGADIAACIAMLPKGVFSDPDIRSAMSDCWRRWLRGEEMLLTVMEDEERPFGERQVAFGASVFVTDEFVRSIHTALMPPACAAVAMEAIQGRRRHLNLQQIREANSGDGLNLLVLAIGWSPQITDFDELSRIRAKLLDAFMFTHSGYKVRATLQEVYSKSEMDRALAIGAFLISDYHRVYGDDDSPTRPYMIGVTRSQVREGSYLWPLFLYNKPRFGFTSAEQEVLKRALIDQTDAEIADALCVSLSSIHKRWQSIFDRAGATDVKWLPIREPSQSERIGRGVEKRRHLLSYMRDHPEELRPTVLQPAARDMEPVRAVR